MQEIRNTENVSQELIKPGAEMVFPCWQAELSALGYGLSEKEWISLISRAGMADMGFEHQAGQLQLASLKADFSTLIESKLQQGKIPYEIVICQAGLGDNAIEVRDTLLALYEVLVSNRVDPEQWNIRFIGLDIVQGAIERAKTFLADDFKAPCYNNLSLSFGSANLNDYSGLEQAITSLSPKGIEADYIMQRHTSYAMTEMFWESQGQRCTVDFDIEPSTAAISPDKLKQIAQLLKIYLPYRNLSLLLGRDGHESGELPTRFVVEPSPYLDPPYRGNYPPSAMDYMPPGTTRLEKRGLGVLELSNKTTIQATSLRDFQSALKATAQQ